MLTINSEAPVVDANLGSFAFHSEGTQLRPLWAACASPLKNKKGRAPLFQKEKIHGITLKTIYSAFVLQMT